MIGILTIKRWRYNWEIVKFELLVDDWFGVVPSGVSLRETVLAGLRDAVVTIIDIIGLSKNGISQQKSNGTCWFLSLFFLIKLHWLVVSNIWIIFHFIYGMSSFPLTFIFFKMVIAPPTSAIFRQKTPELRRTRNDDHRMDFIGFFRWFLTLMSSGTVIYHLPSGK